MQGVHQQRLAVAAMRPCFLALLSNTLHGCRKHHTLFLVDLKALFAGKRIDNDDGVVIVAIFTSSVSPSNYDGDVTVDTEAK